MQDFRVGGNKKRAYARHTRFDDILEVFKQKNHRIAL